MKNILKKIRRPFVRVFISIIYAWACIWYDKKYLVGVRFNRWHFTIGWKWVLRCWFSQKVLGYNKHVPWPVPPTIRVAVPDNIIFDPDDMQNFHGVGHYYQGIGAEIVIGKGSLIANGCGLITANHNFSDISQSAEGKSIVLGEQCWLGMNVVVLPGVTLGPRTYVGAGSVVTKSFPEGNCVIAGNPARLIRRLE